MYINGKFLRAVASCKLGFMEDMPGFDLKARDKSKGTYEHKYVVHRNIDCQLGKLTNDFDRKTNLE